MEIIKKIAIRLLALVAMLIVMNFIYEIFFLEKDLQMHSPIINSVRGVSQETTILYLGESSNTTYSEDDWDKHSISEMLNVLLENEIVSDITKAASHAGIYKILLENVSTNNKIKTVIITLNLRSFSSDWVFSELEAPLQKSMVLLQNKPALYNRFMLSFKGYNPLSERKRFEKINSWRERKFNDKNLPDNVRTWHQFIDNTWGDTNIIQRELAKNYINNFALQIDVKHHPRIKDLDAIVEFSKNKGWNIIFNFLPENTDKINELVGANLLSLMKKNRLLLIEYYSKKGVDIADNLFEVRNEFYIDKDFPTEHYTEEGRKIIARKLVELIE